VLIWALGVLWIPPLVAGELISPHRGYDIRRWATVFPVGMYAASGFETARAAHLPLARSFAAVCTWIAVIVWLVVAAEMTRRTMRTLGSQRP
jgi:tellurite resistance protein TehA-like permease